MMAHSTLLSLLGLFALAFTSYGQSTPSSGTKFSEYILAPTSRTVKPVSIFQVNGSVSDPEALLTSSADANGGATSFQGPLAYVTYDFGKNVAGWINFVVEDLAGDSEGSGATFTVTFTESSLWISPTTSDGIGDPVGNVRPLSCASKWSWSQWWLNFVFIESPDVVQPHWTGELLCSKRIPTRRFQISDSVHGRKRQLDHFEHVYQLLRLSAL
jgi:hypothetical protein